MRVLGTKVDLPRMLLVGLTGIIVVALVGAGLFSTAAFGTYNPNWDGTTELQELADEGAGETVVARDVGAYDKIVANGTTAFVLSPTTAYSPNETERLREFVASGGTLVVAEDFGANANPLLAGLGAQTRVNGTPVRDERLYYQGPSLAVATNVSANQMLTTGVEQVTLNHGSFLTVGPNSTVPIRTSAFAYADTNRNETLDEGETVASYPVVAVESVGTGRVVILSDPSIFLNAMLERDGNQAFALNLVDRRSTVLFDLSHTGGVPPLAALALVLRQFPLALTAVGIIGVAALGLWGRGMESGLAVGLRKRLSVGPTEGDEPDGAQLDTEEVVANVSDRHANWETERLERVAKEVNRRRTEEREDVDS